MRLKLKQRSGATKRTTPAGFPLRRGFQIAFALAVAAGILAPKAALAHAFPEAEQPLVGSTVDAAPARLSIRFDAPIESFLPRLDVVDADGRNQDEGPPQVGASNRELAVKLKPLKPGEYTVHWSVLAEDGHRTQGSYTFTVTGKP